MVFEYLLLRHGYLLFAFFGFGAGFYTMWHVLNRVYRIKDRAERNLKNFIKRMCSHKKWRIVLKCETCGMEEKTNITQDEVDAAKIIFTILQEKPDTATNWDFLNLLGK